MKTNLPLSLLSKPFNAFITFGSTGNLHLQPRNPKKSHVISFAILLTMLIATSTVFSQTNQWNGGGTNSWTDGTRWSLGHMPTASEDVVVLNNKTLNVNTAAVCKSFTINGGNGSNPVTITGSNSLTVTNAITINATTSAQTKTIGVGSGTLSCASITMGAPTLGTCSITASTGTINVTGNITMNGSGTSNAFTFTGAGTLNIGGDLTGGTFTCSTSTVNCNTASTQTMSGGYTFYNLTVNKTASGNTVDFSAPFTVNNNLTISTGTASITGTTANYTVTNDVVISASGTLINTVDYAATSRTFNVGGSWTNNQGVFTPGTGMVNFNTVTANENINGSSTSQSFYHLTVNKSGRQVTVGGSTATLNIGGTVTLTAGTLDAGTATTINMNGGDWVNNGGTFTPGSGVVNFANTSADQNIMGTAASQTFYDVTVNKVGRTLSVAGSTNTLVLNDDLLLTAGSFAAGTATTINIAGDWTNNGATFTPGSGTVNFNNTSSSQQINGTAISQTFNNVTVTKTAQTLSVGGSTSTLNANGTITLSSGIFSAGTAASINVGGNWTNNGATFTYGTSTVTFNSITAAQNINGTAASQSFYNIVVNKTGQQLNGAGSTTTVNVYGTMTLTAGTLAAGTVTNINMAGGNWINNGATFTPGSGTVTFSNTTAAQSITGTVSSHTFNNINVNKTGQQLNVSGSANTLNLNGSMTLTAGTFNYGTAPTINIGGNWTNNGGTFTYGTSTVTFNSTTGAQNINGTAASQSFYNVIVNKAGQQLNGAGSTTSLDIYGNVTLTAGTFAAGTITAINLPSGDWTNNGGTFTPNSSTVTFSKTTGAQNINGTAASQTFNNITINKSGQQLNIAGSTTTLNLNGTLTITAGTFAAGTALAINVGGDWINNGTGFTPGTGTVTFNGSAAQNISGSTATSFYNLGMNNSAGLTLNSADVNITGGAGALAFTNGRITTGVYKIILGTTGTITGAGAGKYVNGNLQLGIATGSPTRVFEVGDASIYAPVSVAFNNVTVSGSIVGSTTGSEHPNILTSTIDETKDVNRYWRLTNSGVSLTNYTATFNFNAADIDAGASFSNFILGRRSSSWAYPTVGAKTATSIAATLSSFGDYACGEGGASVPTIATQPLDLSGCDGGSMSLTAAANSTPVSTVVWEISTDGGSTFNTLTIASPYSVNTTSASGVTTSTLTVNPTSYTMNLYSFRAIFTNSRGNVTSSDGMFTLIQGPTVNVGAALSPICSGGASAPLGGSVGGSATGGTWSTASGGTFTPNANTLNATWTPPGGFTGTATLILTTTGGTCGSASDSKTIAVGAAPSAITISPSSATVCRNAVQALSVTPTSATQTTGAITQAIPDNDLTGITNTLAISGIPSYAVISGITVNFNISHNNDGDLNINLKAPNGSILNLVNRKGGTGNNFTNTTVSSAGTTTFASSSSPFTGTFAANAANNVGATGYKSNVAAFSFLYGTPNGNWTLVIDDEVAARAGTLTSWTITINYTSPITWSPITNLYTDAAATSAYTGTSAATVYFKSSTAITTTYTATATTDIGCTSTQTVAVTAGPVVTVTPDYCYGGGYIQLSASSSPAATSWLWSTGATTSSVLVNLAGNYTVTATTAAGCTNSVTVPVAQELVVNGDFSAGDAGFSSSYGSVAYTSGCMYPEAIYTVGPDPNFTHGYFFGHDHTTGSGNMLIVNGSGTPVSVWQQTITVQPNTTYYFSAWAMSLNDAAPFAQLQFDINGSGIGTTAVLPAGPNSTSAPYSWTQFYGSWTSGAGVTSATVSIKDLQTAFGGNDFGIDDISFGTLATFVSLSSASGTDAQTVCQNAPITNITYTAGGGVGSPTVSGLPAGVSYSFSNSTV
ncbi:MAG: proprotein convertase P-domain-containing protein, partial [Bacteroidetes bacterium]|nr:proprotein convertase P-domain-containing protein [Bacteroidota bacterium]